MTTKKILGLIASQRKLGNGEIVVKAVARELGKGWAPSSVGGAFQKKED